MRRLLYGLVLCTAILAGCSSEEKKVEEKKSAAVKEQAEEIKLTTFTEEAWLREALPEKSVLYLRLPNPWFYFTGLDNGFKYAQQNEGHVQQLEVIRQGINERIGSQVGPAMEPVVSTLLKHTVAPLELAALTNEANPAAPIVMLATKLDFETIESFQDNLNGLLTLNRMIENTDPTDANGHGSFLLPDVMTTVVYRFNPGTKEFLMVAGSGIDQQSLNAAMDGVKPVSSHPMYALENTIDTSKQGLFGYVDAKTVLPMMEGLIPPNAQLGLSMSGLAQMNALAFGYGTSRGKSRLKVIVDMPNVGFRAYLPLANNSLNFNARGNIDSLGVVSLPTAAQFNIIESTIVSATGPDPDYEAFKQLFKEKTGLELGQILDIIGPEVAYFSDEISDFIAVRLRNPEQFSELIKKAVDMGWLQYDEYTKNNTTIKHVALSFHNSLGAVGPLQKSVENDMFLSVFLNLFGSIGSHYYYIEEDGYIIAANIPQPLVERSLRNDTVSVNNWLASSQKHDMNSAILGFTASKDDISRDYYYHYLALLRALADISGAEVDFFAFPHAGQLKFADQGSVGVSLESGVDHLALEVNFEESLADMFYVGGTYESVAVVGIMAAIAIPQFEKYRERAAQQH
ncbi:hypothetical protein [Desulfogranum japonicum]|uniref:hypothetical protein n=1 Tax=Desulfogranum japonicum TaxID=231447 RepID=UPI000421C741|nr:hypothetical protein [Desulfogranum japonicum]